MVETELDDSGQNGRIILQGNRSLSWKQNLVFLGIMATIWLTISLVYASMGVWVIFLASLFSLCVLFSAFYLVARATSEKTVIELDSEMACITRGHRQPEQHWQHQRSWLKCHYELNEDEQPDTIHLGSKGVVTEVARPLNYDDRELLLKVLRKAGIPCKKSNSQSTQ